MPILFHLFCLFSSTALLAAIDETAWRKIRVATENAGSSQAKAVEAEKQFLTLKSQNEPLMWDFHSLMVSAASELENFEKVKDLLGEVPVDEEGLSTFARYQYVIAQARMNQFQGSTEKAKELYDRSYNLSRELVDPAYALTPIIALAFLNSQQGNHEKVLEYLQILQSLEHTASDKIKAAIYAESAGLYFDTGDYARAIEYGEKSIELAIRANSVMDLGAIHANQGLFHASAGDQKSALTHRLRALELSKPTGSESLLARRNLSVASSLRSLDRLPEAYSYLKDLPAVFDKAGIPRFQIESRRELASVLEGMKQDEEALRFYDEALGILKAQENSIKNEHIRLEILNDKRRLQARLKNWVRAYETADSYIALKEAFVESEKNKGMTEFRIKYDTVMKEKENEKLETKAQLSSLALEQERQSSKFYRILTASLAAFVIILSCLIFFIVRILRQLQTAKALTEWQAAEITAMLSTIDQGIFTLQGAELSINQQMSAFARDHFHLQPGGSFPDFLANQFDISKDEIRIVRSILTSSLDMLDIGFTADSDKLPKELKRATADGILSYEVDWVPMIRPSDKRIEQFLICIRDVTEFRKIQLAMDDYRERLQFLGRLADCGLENFRNFHGTYQNYFKEIRAQIAGSHASVYSAAQTIVLKRHIHTLKGLSRMLNFLDVSNACHEFEEALAIAGQPIDATLITRQLDTFDQVIGRYLVIARDKLAWDLDSEKIGVERQRLRAISNQIQGSQEARWELMKLCFPSLHKTLQNSVPGLVDLAKTLKKPLPEVHVSGDDVLIDDATASVIAGAMPHLFRNSLDHGIEAEDTRIAASKSREGHIHITSRSEGAWTVMTFADDGQGLQLERIRAKAIEKGLVTAGSERNAGEWADLIFSPGFSTVDHASQISGRGVGMDAIRASLMQVQGCIELILSHPNAQTLAPQTVVFRLTFPALR